MHRQERVRETGLAAGIVNLRCKFPGEQGLLFQGLSLSVSQGEKVLLLGASGSGKSTLLQILSGIIPHAVEMPMKCDDILVPKRAGIVFQDPDAQFCMSHTDEEIAFVLENRNVPREQMAARIGLALQQVGLAFEGHRAPIQSLSQGMKQRLAIASILALEPDVLFMDEPTALLDGEGTLQVWDTVKRIAHNKTLIIVEHKIDEIVDWVDRIVVLSPEGQIAADGPAAQIFAEQRDLLRSYGIWYPGVWDEQGQQAGSAARHEPGVRQQLREEPLLELRDATGWRGSTEVVRVDKLEVRPGDWIGVVGANGAGKSSLLLSMMHILKTTGDYRVMGKPAGTTQQLAERMAFVFQNPEFQFVTNSVVDEVEFSLLGTAMSPAERQANTLGMLEEFGLAALADRHPYQLSMGQKRRLSVASALIRGQRILLLDEPTFGQDARNTFAMLSRLDELRRRGTAIVMVTHDSEIVSRYCTRTWKVDGGRVMDAAVFPPS